MVRSLFFHRSYSIPLMMSLPIIIFVHSETILSICPNINNQSWAKNATVYCYMSGISDSVVVQQIQWALDIWNSSNDVNGSGVHFVAGVAAPSGAPTLYFEFGSSNGTYSGWFQNTQVIYTSNTLLSSTITFYIGGHLEDGSPIYDASNLNACYEMFLKTALHEIGHTMGLEDVFGKPETQLPHQDSVMYAYWGSNDQGGNCPTNVTDCDRNAIQCNACSRYCSSGEGGGGGEGGDNGSGGQGGDGCIPTYMQTVIYINDVPYPLGDPVYAGCL